MTKRKPHIVQDERGQDQPTSKRAAHHTEPTMPKDASELDPRDIGSGVHDPLNDQERPQPHHVQLKTTRHEWPSLPQTAHRRPSYRVRSPTFQKGCEDRAPAHTDQREEGPSPRRLQQTVGRPP
jgi:hypothetical protein